LIATGYVREEPIGNFGSSRSAAGSSTSGRPTRESVRIEFFGDTVDSIREFDPDTQLSTGQLTEIAIAPMREFCSIAKGSERLGVLWRGQISDERFRDEISKTEQTSRRKARHSPAGNS
jgi:transcription-repair coupling factor (superfamily II helicase)